MVSDSLKDTSKEINRPARLLLVEDEADILEQNGRHLSAQGYEVLCATTLRDAKSILRRMPPDLIVLDVLMPDGSGYDFCEEIRRFTSAPIIFLTCLDKNENIIHGLTTGGDDYLTKPFDLNVLSAHIIAQLRRTGLQGAGRIEVPPLSIDLRNGLASLNGNAVRLTHKELQLLAFFASNIGKILTSEFIYETVWADNSIGAVNTVKKHISSIRTKLGFGIDGAAFDIVFTRKRGYVLNQLIDEPED